MLGSGPGKNDSAVLLCLVDERTRKEASKGATFIRVLVLQTRPGYKHVAKFKSQLFCIVAFGHFCMGLPPWR